MNGAVTGVHVGNAEHALTEQISEDDENQGWGNYRPLQAPRDQRECEQCARNQGDRDEIHIDFRCLPEFCAYGFAVLAQRRHRAKCVIFSIDGCWR